MSLQSYEAIYEHGKMKWLGEAPPVEEARVIVTILPGRCAAKRPRPSVRIAGKGKIRGDIMAPMAPLEDWNCAR